MPGAFGDAEVKILFVTRPIVPPWDEGSKKTVFALARQMKGHEVHLLSTPGFSPREKNIVAEPVFSKGGFLTGISLSQKLRLFFRLLRRDDIDICHFFFKPTPMVALAAKIALRLNGKKAVQTVVTVPPKGERVRQTIFSKNLVVGSRFMQRRLKQEGIHAELIPFGIDISQLPKPSGAQSVKKEFGWGNEPVILFPGHLIPGGGSLELAAAMPAIVKKFPNAKFVFACRSLPAWGEKETVAKLNSMVKAANLENNMQLLRKANWERLVQAADIVAFAPTSMAFKMDYPLSLLEAMAMGKAVVFSNTQPLDELFEKGSNVMVESGNAARLSQAIISLLSDRKKAALLGKNASSLVERKFNIQDLAAMYAALYTRLGGAGNG